MSGENFYDCANVEAIHYLKGSTGIMANRTSWISNNQEEGEVSRYYTLEYNARDSIQSIDFEEGIVHIGAYAFADGSGLTEITIPSTLESIGEHAFNGQKNMNMM